MPQLSVHSPLGPLTITEADNAIVSLDWGWAPDAAQSGLLALACDQLDAYFAGTRQTFQLPLAPRGTPFQKNVWSHMLNIPYGGKATYGDVARTLDSAPRAVGGACGRNPIPIFIPCHRVVGGGGRLTGYSGAGGIGTKQYLLDLEAGKPV